MTGYDPAQRGIFHTIESLRTVARLLRERGEQFDFAEPEFGRVRVTASWRRDEDRQVSVAMDLSALRPCGAGLVFELDRESIRDNWQGSKELVNV